MAAGLSWGLPAKRRRVSGDRGLFDMMVALGKRHEWGIAPDEQTAAVTKDGEALVARYGKLRHGGAEHDVRIELRFTLEGDGVVCEAQLENRSDLVIEEFWFPWVGPFRSLGGGPGQRHADPAGRLRPARAEPGGLRGR